MHEERHVAQRLRLLLEQPDELLADDAALELRLGHALEPRQEPVGGVDVDQRHLEVLAEGLHHPLGLVLAQQAVVDEHARQLVAHRAMHEQGRDGRIDAARKRADHL